MHQIFIIRKITEKEESSFVSPAYFYPIISVFQAAAICGFSLYQLRYIYNV